MKRLDDQIKKGALMNKALNLCWIFLIAISLLIGGCGDSSTSPTATYSIGGAWVYTLLTTTETLDAGTITFVGADTAGAFTLVNTSADTETGVYSVNGVTVTMTGSQTWSGTFSNESTMSGTWKDSDTSASGTWIALKQL